MFELKCNGALGLFYNPVRVVRRKKSMDERVKVSKNSIKHFKVDLDYPEPQYAFDLCDLLDVEDYNTMFRVVSQNGTFAEFEIVRPKWRKG